MKSKNTAIHSIQDTDETFTSNISMAAKRQTPHWPLTAVRLYSLPGYKNNILWECILEQHKNKKGEKEKYVFWQVNYLMINQNLICWSIYELKIDLYLLGRTIFKFKASNCVKKTVFFVFPFFCQIDKMLSNISVQRCKLFWVW